MTKSNDDNSELLRVVNTSKFCGNSENKYVLRAYRNFFVLILELFC